MEEKLFKTALEFIEKYKITAYSILIEPHRERFNLVSSVKIQGHAFENYKAMMELDVENTKGHDWYSFTENGVDLTLTYD